MKTLVRSLLLVTLLCGSAPLTAQSTTLWRVGLAAGIGGTEDADVSPGYDASVLQLTLGMNGEAGTSLVARIGSMDFDGEQINSLVDPEMRWATLGGEYRFRGRWFESGLFLALGGYQLEGDFAGVSEDETAWGLSFGSTAEWRLSQHFSVDAELSGHWADFDQAQIFLVGLVGVSVHF
jgi:hypothetical protein